MPKLSGQAFRRADSESKPRDGLPGPLPDGDSSDPLRRGSSLVLFGARPSPGAFVAETEAHHRSSTFDFRLTCPLILVKSSSSILRAIKDI